MDAIVPVEKRHEIGDGADEVEADWTEQVRRAAIGGELGGESLDLASYVAVGAVWEGDWEDVHAGEPPMGEEVTLPVGVRVPVTQHLGAVRGTPDEVKGMFLLHQQGSARARPWEPPRQLVVGAKEAHPVDASDSCHLEASRVEKGW